MSAFADRHVVVTGATGELGFAVVEALLAGGAICHLPCRSAAKLPPIPTPQRAKVRAADGVDPTDERSIGAFYAELPLVWASIHCVGAFGFAAFTDTTVDELRGLHSTNVLSAYLCAREAVKKMRITGGGGRIVNVAARAVLEPRRGAGAIPYAMSKAAVGALTQALAAEVVGEGILVNAIAPSILDTRANRSAMPGADYSVWPKLEEVARVVLALASPENLSIHGAIVPLFGGA